MNKFETLAVLAMMLTGNCTVQLNNNNTVTVIGDGDTEGITVPNIVYNACRMICDDEAWDINSELNNPLEANELLSETESTDNLDSPQVQQAVMSQYDEIAG